MRLQWLLVIFPIFVVLLLVVLGALMGRAERQLIRAARRLAEERFGDTTDSFIDEMLRVGVAADVNRALYAEMSRSLEVHGIYRFPARADDELSAVYGIVLPEKHNDFADTDLRDIVNGIAGRSGRSVMAAGDERDKQLAELRTVRDLGRWVSALTRSDSESQ